jgi:dimethylhistidine N-methyltransferase
MNKQFLEDVDAGLSREQKSLPSKYFYDKSGDELFMQIMDLPEYYLTRAELEIFTRQTTQMIDSLGVDHDTRFDLIELGPGDGIKTKKLMGALFQQGFQFDYLPIDISSNVLEHLQGELSTDIPGLSVKPMQGDYFKVLGDIKNSQHPKVVLFLGSNIGNLRDRQAARFIDHLADNLDEGDKLLLGVDRIKPAEIVLPAYDDEKGVTKQFNLNLLRRINRELGANFKLDQFEHVAEYTEEEGIAKSFLKSTCDQVVGIPAAGKTYTFEQGDKIHTEISRKYDTEVMSDILSETDFRIIDELTDSKRFFIDYILEIQ